MLVCSVAMTNIVHCVHIEMLNTHVHIPLLCCIQYSIVHMEWYSVCVCAYTVQSLQQI